MKRINASALVASGFFAAAILTVATLPATAANLLAHYPMDSVYYVGTPGVDGVPKTPNTAPGSTWGDATLNYSGGLIYGGDFESTNSITGGTAYREDLYNMSKIFFGSWDPFAATGSFTYMLWVWDPFATTAGLGTMLLSKQLANNDHYFRIILRSGNTNPDQDDIQIGAYNGGFQDRTTSALTNVISDPSLKWVHIAVTGSKSGGTVTWQVFANGVQVPFAANTATLDATKASYGLTCGITIGSQPTAYPNLIVDDIRFYDGMLTAEEIQAISGINPVASIDAANDLTTVNWTSIPGKAYELLQTTSLATQSWTTNPASPVIATNTMTSVSEALGTGETYYQVHMLP